MSVDAGFETSLGGFSATTTMDANGEMSMDFSAPSGTMGAVSVPYPACSGQMTLREVNGKCEDVVVDVVAQENASGRIEVEGLVGGNWEVRFSCS